MLLTMRYDYEYDEHNLVVVHDIIIWSIMILHEDGSVHKFKIWWLGITINNKQNKYQ